MPLTEPHTAELFDKFTIVMRATVKGTLLVAANSGSAGRHGILVSGCRSGFVVGRHDGISGTVAAFGSALVWVPVAAYFLLTGAIWQSLVLTLWGVLVIGLIDNLLRPMLVGRDAHLPDYVVMIATVGGLSVFGIHGFVLGPVIAAMFTGTSTCVTGLCTRCATAQTVGNDRRRLCRSGFSYLLPFPDGPDQPSGI